MTFDLEGIDTIEQQDPEVLAARLEANGGYRILRRVTPRTHFHASDGTATRRGIFLDVETTGLDAKTDEIIELAMIPFDYTDDGRIFDVYDSFNALRDPGRPIPAAITSLTRITDAMVAGTSIEVAEVTDFLGSAALVVAHNAGFDRARSAKGFVPPLLRQHGRARGARFLGRTKGSTERGFPIWQPATGCSSMATALRKTAVLALRCLAGRYRVAGVRGLPRYWNRPEKPDGACGRPRRLLENARSSKSVITAGAMDRTVVPKLGILMSMRKCLRRSASFFAVRSTARTSRSTPAKLTRSTVIPIGVEWDSRGERVTVAALE
jgi:Exonuclease